MFLYLLRHEKAQERTPGHPDSERSLTPQGLTNALKKVKQLRKKLKNTSLILSSPYPRAWQTAEVYANALEIADKLKSEISLMAGSNATQILKHLAGVLNPHSQDEVLLVGHETWLSELASLLICGNTNANVGLKKGGIMKLKIDVFTPHGGQLVWLR
jgi:phosphohistidine phosphatase